MHVDMLKSACGALWNISENEDPGTANDYGEGTSVVLDVMSGHPGHAELQKNACSFLRNAVSDPTSRDILEKEEGVSIMLTVCRVFRADADFMEIVLDVLRGLNCSNARPYVYDSILAAVLPLFKLYQAPESNPLG